MFATLRTRGTVPLILALLAVPIGPAATSLAGQEAGGPEVRRYGELPYMTGGVGEEEREAMEAIARREGFNLKLVLATREGTYLAGVPLRISSPDGTLRLEATAEGPWLYARLPAGEYRVEGLFPAGNRAATVTVPAEGRREHVLTAP